MDAKPSSPSDSGQAQQSEVERLGPLELRRLRKEDGRRLITYARVEHDPPIDRAPTADPDET